MPYPFAMHSSIDIKGKCSVVCGLIFALTSLVSCTLFYPVAVMLQGEVTRHNFPLLFEDAGKLTVIKARYFEKKFRILSPEFPVAPLVENLHPGNAFNVQLEVERDTSVILEANLSPYLLKVSGSVTSLGVMELPLRLSCCATMSGSTLVATGVLRLEVQASD